MGITIGISIDDKFIEQDEFVLLDDELIDYICRLEQFPTLKQLGHCDPYGDTLIPLAMQNELKKELLEIIGLAENHDLPEPPDYVGLDGSANTELGEKFGWQGLVSFFRRLERVLSNNKPLLAIGD